MHLHDQLAAAYRQMPESLSDTWSKTSKAYKMPASVSTQVSHGPSLHWHILLWLNQGFCPCGCFTGQVPNSGTRTPQSPKKGSLWVPGAVNQIEAPQCLDLDPPNRFNPSLGAAVGLRKKRPARTPPPQPASEMPMKWPRLPSGPGRF